MKILPLDNFFPLSLCADCFHSVRRCVVAMGVLLLRCCDVWSLRRSQHLQGFCADLWVFLVWC